MRNLVTAILAMAFATLVWQPAGANLNDQPTMKQLSDAIDSIDDAIGEIDDAVGDIEDDLAALDGRLTALTTTVGNLATTAAVQSLAAKVDSHAGRGEQMAIFMTDPSTNPAGLYHIGQSTIPGFPPGPKDSHGRIAQTGAFSLNPAMKLPAGSYLFELQQPRTDSIVCIHSVTQRRGVLRGAVFGQFRVPCPSIRLALSDRARDRLAWIMDGAGIFTTDGTESFHIGYYFPLGFTFTTERPRSAYIGAVKVTKIK